MNDIFRPDDWLGPESPPPQSITITEIIRRRASGFRPPARMSVDQAACRYRYVKTAGGWVPWSNDLVPYMVEPQQQITSRRYRGLAFCGPARSAKTAALIENTIVHSIRCQPRITAVFQMSGSAARTYSVEKLAPMIRESPELAARLMSGSGNDNILDKTFLGDMRLTIGWPVGSQFASRDIPVVLMTEYDKYPLSIEDEGSPFLLGLKRTQTEGSQAMVVAETSPRHPIKVENWKASSPHEAPPCEGILSIYNDGTRGRFYYRCTECAEEFEPRLERLKWDLGAPPGEAGRSVKLICPHCGGIMSPDQRYELNRTGRWLHETAEGGIAPLGDQTRDADIVTYWLAGACAAWATWPEMVDRLVRARIKAEAGDDDDLIAVMNTDFGLPHRPFVALDAEDLNEDILRSRAVDYPLGVAPDWVRFVTIAVDTQKGYFIWQADAWGVSLERRIIARGKFFAPPPDAPGSGDRPLDPARYGEDWAVLLALEAMRFPIEGQDATIAAVGIVVDMQGEAGVTDKARAFWLDRKRHGAGGLWHMSRGIPGRLRKRVERVFPESAHGKNKVRRDVPILNLAVDMLKDQVYAQLVKDGGGASSMALSVRLDADVFAELAGERKTAKGWRKKQGVIRNEAWDLSTYNLGLAIGLKADVINYDAAPAWAAPWHQNSNVDAGDRGGAEVARPVDAPAMKTKAPPPVPVRRPALRRGPKGARF